VSLPVLQTQVRSCSAVGRESCRLVTGGRLWTQTDRVPSSEHLQSAIARQSAAKTTQSWAGVPNLVLPARREHVSWASQHVATRKPGAITGAVSTPNQPPRRRPLRWPWWVAGGCALLLVGTVLLAVLAVAVFNIARSSYTSCLPHDFPAYPSAHLKSNFDRYAGTGPNGDLYQCEQTLDTNDAVAMVDRFYASHLDSGDWKLIDNSATDGLIAFRRISRPLTSGTIQMRPLQLLWGLGTRIYIGLDH
jgi:hypothetical protein